jgi:thiamine pyrophosphate-dependent acetolactate synthase large subunit-like protein
MQLGKFHPVKLPIWGEIGAFCDLVKQKVKRQKSSPDQISELKERWNIWRAEKASRMAEETSKGIHSFAIFDALSRLAPDDAIIAVDVGNNTYSFGRYFETKGQRVLMSGYLGSIGFGFPAAMGAWAATQDFEEFKGRKVISISGDGGFGQYPMGKISKEQRSGEWPVWQTDLHNPSFSAFAKLCGAHGQKVTESCDIEAALKKALDVDGPALVEFMTDPELI